MKQHFLIQPLERERFAELLRADAAFLEKNMQSGFQSMLIRAIRAEYP